MLPEVAFQWAPVVSPAKVLLADYELHKKGTHTNRCTGWTDGVLISNELLTRSLWEKHIDCVHENCQNWAK